jgi:hypothetical protein
MAHQKLVLACFLKKHKIEFIYFETWKCTFLGLENVKLGQLGADISILRCQKMLQGVIYPYKKWMPWIWATTLRRIEIVIEKSDSVLWWNSLCNLKWLKSASMADIWMMYHKVILLKPKFTCFHQIYLARVTTCVSMRPITEALLLSIATRVIYPQNHLVTWASLNWINEDKKIRLA